jgi:hypothetical protein
MMREFLSSLVDLIVAAGPFLTTFVIILAYFSIRWLVGYIKWWNDHPNGV